MADQAQLSKYLALVLRHRAEDFGLSLDSEGFASLDDVWALVEERYPNRFQLEDLYAVVAGDQFGKKRYEIRGDTIRAMYGHSKVRKVTYPPVKPPALLYHGTTRKALSAIQKNGLKPGKRQYVHMTNDYGIAERVAKRHDRDIVILSIRAEEAYTAGVVFYNPEDKNYLAPEIPPTFIEFPE